MPGEGHTTRMTAALLLIAIAQTPASIPEAKAEDVATPDAIILSLYDVISGPAGQKRDWNRFRSLFGPKGNLTAIGKTAKGETFVVAMSPEDYVTRSGPAIESRGFFEKEVDRRSEQQGSIVHAWSKYEARFKAEDEKPISSGTNAIQLYSDGKRWYIHSVLWQPTS